MTKTKGKTPPYLGENLSQIKKLGLQSNINDLEIDGFTVIPPKKVASTNFLNKMRKTVLRLCDERTGKKFSIMSYIFG